MAKRRTNLEWQALFKQLRAAIYPTSFLRII